MLCAADSNRSTCRIYSHHTRPARAHRSLTNHDTRIRNLAQLIWPAPFSTQRSSQTENEQRRRRTTPTTNSDNQRRRQRTTTNRQTTNRQTDDEQRATNSPFHPSSQSLSASHHQSVTRSQSVSQSVSQSLSLTQNFRRVSWLICVTGYGVTVQLPQLHTQDNVLHVPYSSSPFNIDAIREPLRTIQPFTALSWPSYYSSLPYY